MNENEVNERVIVVNSEMSDSFITERQFSSLQDNIDVTILALIQR